MADYSRGYEDERYGRRYEEDDDRHGRGGRWRGREDRGFLDRAGDEVRSWFGDEDAERRRMIDDREYGRDFGREIHRQGARGEYERGYGREGARGEYERGHGGYGGSPEYRREGRSGARGYSSGADYGRGYGGEYGYEPGSGSPYWSYTEMWMIPGPYTGRGPTGYRRSDDRIIEDICERLQQHGQIDASYITVNVTNGEATMTGTVDSRLEKRLAEDVVESCSGVREIHNNLRVRSREQQQSQFGEQPAASQTQPSSQYGTQPEPRSRFTTG